MMNRILAWPAFIALCAWVGMCLAAEFGFADTRYLGPGNDVVLDRSLTEPARIDLGDGQDVALTGGGNGQDVECSGGNDRVVDKCYNESLPAFPQDVAGTTLPWVGRHVFSGNRERGFHVYDLGASDQGRITLPIRTATAASGGFAMDPRHTAGDFVIHGPGFVSRPTIIKSYDWFGPQRIVMSGSPAVTAVTMTGTRVDRFTIRSSTADPATNGQTVQVDTAFLPPSSELHITVGPKGAAFALNAFLIQTGRLLAH